MTDWQPEPRPVPAELDEQFDHATYPKPATFFPNIADRMDAATHEQLLAMAKGVI